MSQVLWFFLTVLITYPLALQSRVPPFRFGFEREPRPAERYHHHHWLHVWYFRLSYYCHGSHVQFSDVTPFLSLPTTFRQHDGDRRNRDTKQCALTHVPCS